MPVEINPGQFAETVGDILGTGPGDAPRGPITPAKIEHPEVPDFPTPGIYFDMPEELYHRIPGLSATGIKKLAASPMLFWACSSWLNEAKLREEIEKAAKEKAHFSLGKAYHCRLMEGASEFALRFAIGLAPSELEGALDTVDQIKAAIEECGAKPRGKNKADYIEQLKFLQPDCVLKSELLAAHAALHEGKTFISAEEQHKLEIAALMIERHPTLSKAFTGGHAEVSIFWYDPATGAPMKARIDYLKLKAINDLKSIGNGRERAIETAIRYEIASYHYNVQPVVYLQAVAAAKLMIREQGADAVHAPDNIAQRVEWCLRWAAEKEPPTFMWVFQQTGVAPITRGVIFPRSAVYTATLDIVESMKRRWVDFNQTFGAEPWLDIAPIYQIADEEIPLGATEF